jgi:hypothetical protein
MIKLHSRRSHALDNAELALFIESTKRFYTGMKSQIVVDPMQVLASQTQRWAIARIHIVRIGNHGVETVIASAQLDHH